MMKKFAWIISRVFDPAVEIPVVLAAAAYYALMNGLRFRFLIFLILVDAFLPAMYMVWGIKTRRISDWDMTKREQRGELYFLTVFLHLFGVVLAFFLGKIVMAKILFVLWSLALIFALITMVWKISVHAGVNGAMLSFFCHLYGWQNYWWLVIILVLVLWSRVEIKKHSILQVSLGSILAIGWVELGLKILGL